MLVITQWGDTGYPYGLITGLPAVGTAPWYGIFPAQQCVQITLEDVLAETHQHNLDVIARPKPGVHDEFLIAQSLVDVDKGFGTPPMRWSDLVRSTGGRPLRLIPRCVIVQPSSRSVSWTMLQQAGSLTCLLTPTSWCCVVPFALHNMWQQLRPGFPRVTGRS